MVSRSNQEIKIDFGGTIFDEQETEIYFLDPIDQFAKFPTACIYEKAKSPDIIKFFDM